MSLPLPGEKYQHYKGGTYEVISLCTHTETNEKLVIYQSLNYGSVHARPLDQWFDEIPGIPGFVPTVRFVLV
jgi:hypothetical protein